VRSPLHVVDRFDAALARRTSEWRGRVERVFAHAAVLRPDDREGPALTFLSSLKDLVPLSAALPRGVPLPREGSTVSFRKRTLRIADAEGARALLLRGPGISLELPEKKIALSREALRAHVEFFPPPSAPFPEPAAEEEIAARLLGGCVSEEAYRGRILALSGLGPGLTPSGDDRLVGLAAAALHLSRGGRIAREAVSTYLGALGRVPRGHTTPVAREMLLHASGRRFPEALIAFVSILGDPRAPLSEVAARSLRLAAIGARTGADLIDGALGLARSFDHQESAA